LLLTEKPQNEMGYTVMDGEVVIARTVVAKSYNSENDIKGISEAAEIQKEIEILQKAQSSVVTLRNIETVSAQVNKIVGNLVFAQSLGDLSELSEIHDDMQFQLAKRAVLSGEKDFKQKITELTAKKEGILAPINEGENIPSGMNGYFSSQTDGLESKIKYSTLKSFSFEDLAGLMESCKTGRPTNFVGKVMHDHNWSVMIITDNEKAAAFTMGEKVILDFKQTDQRNIPAVISALIPVEGGHQTAVIFDCSVVNAFVLSERLVDVEVSSKSFSGLKISQKALRFLNDKEGVYVIEGGAAVFKAVDIIYKTDRFVICNEAISQGGLRLFDEVIV
ncbi:MAG: HlyD family efflux transporter periplasmic adaptor subunit, partial [Oscillospiraceae bacterium]